MSRSMAHRGDAMTKEPEPATATIFSLKPKSDTRKASEQKYGKPVTDVGCCIVPSLRIHPQARLTLNPEQFNIRMHLAGMWWDAEDRPWPTKLLVAERMITGERQIRRHIAALVAAGLMRRTVRTEPGRGKTSKKYVLSGLVTRLQE